MKYHPRGQALFETAIMTPLLLLLLLATMWAVRYTVLVERSQLSVRYSGLVMTHSNPAGELSLYNAYTNLPGMQGNAQRPCFSPQRSIITDFSNISSQSSSPYFQQFQDSVLCNSGSSSLTSISNADLSEQIVFFLHNDGLVSSTLATPPLLKNVMGVASSVANAEQNYLRVADLATTMQCYPNLGYTAQYSLQGGTDTTTQASVPAILPADISSTKLVVDGTCNIGASAPLLPGGNSVLTNAASAVAASQVTPAPGVTPASGATPAPGGTPASGASPAPGPSPTGTPGCTAAQQSIDQQEITLLLSGNLADAQAFATANGLGTVVESSPGCLNIGNVNSGCGNIGNANNGSGNDGNGNTGNGNTGNGNSGKGNNGNGNSHNGNNGNGNSGSSNCGNGNSGASNNGNGNSGGSNNGNGNSGGSNNGNGNSGNGNNGNGNSGNGNNGNGNSGNGNNGNGKS